VSEGGRADGAGRDDGGSGPPRGLFDRWAARRRARIRDEIERAQDSRVPTWVLGLALVLLVAGWVVVVVLA